MLALNSGSATKIFILVADLKKEDTMLICPTWQQLYSLACEARAAHADLCVSDASKFTLKTLPAQKTPDQQSMAARPYFGDLERGTVRRVG